LEEFRYPQAFSHCYAQVYDSAPSPSQVSRAAKVLEAAESPIILAGHGAACNNAHDALLRFSEHLHISVATTFMGKGVFPDRHPNALGTVGSMLRDYVNFGFDLADVLICVGYDLQEFDPIRINPKSDKKIIHISRYPAEVDVHYPVAVGIESDLSMALHDLAKAVRPQQRTKAETCKIVELLRGDLEDGVRDSSFPVKPQQIVSDIRLALGESDIVLVDIGAVKMWMVRLYPTYKPNTCLISNGLSTIAFALPGDMAAKLACSERKVLAAVGDGGFLMLGSELATAVRDYVPIVVLIWEDGAYGLIKWKMHLELGRHSSVDFQNPDFLKYAESFGAKGYRINHTDELLPILKSSLIDDAVSVITCPVDYSKNIDLTNKLGLVTEVL
jgi:acetolactate synthase I/II/III large subunit